MKMYQKLCGVEGGLYKRETPNLPRGNSIQITKNSRRLGPAATIEKGRLLAT